MRDTTDDTSKALDRFMDSMSLGIKPNVYLYNVISKRARQKGRTLSDIKRATTLKEPASSIRRLLLRDSSIIRIRRLILLHLQALSST